MRVTAVEVDTDAVTVWLELKLQTATPVCCDEPGCYIPFLGHKRAQVPDAVARAVGRTEAAVTIIVALVHEPGYQHIEKARDAIPWGPKDAEYVYDKSDWELPGGET